MILGAAKTGGSAAGDVKHRTRTEIDAAFRDLPGLVVVSESEDRAQTGGGRMVGAPRSGCERDRIRAGRGLTYLTGENDLPNRGTFLPG